MTTWRERRDAALVARILHPRRDKYGRLWVGWPDLWGRRRALLLGWWAWPAGVVAAVHWGPYPIRWALGVAVYLLGGGLVHSTLMLGAVSSVAREISREQGEPCWTGRPGPEPIP